MKRNLLTAMIALSFIFALVTPAKAALVDVAFGSLTSGLNGGLTVSGAEWQGNTGANFNTTLTWKVQYDAAIPNIWTYTYTWDAKNKYYMDYIDIEVKNGFIASAPPSGNLVNSNPKPATLTLGTFIETAGSIYALKSNPTATNLQTYTLTLVTNTRPMWGDFYVDGITDGYYAYNSGYTSSDVAFVNPFGATGNTNITGKLAVPTPIPAAAWMLGAGLIGLVAIRRRKK